MLNKDLNFASRQFGAPRLKRGRDASLPRVARGRERRRCISILQTARNPSADGRQNYATVFFGEHQRFCRMPS